MDFIKSIFINRITELSTYAGIMLILAPVMPISLMLVFGILLIGVGDKTLQGVIAKFAPGLKKYLESI